MFSFFKKNSIDQDVLAAYRIIMAQSRQPVYFVDWGIADDVTGRFDILSLNMALVLRRLKQSGDTQKDFSQALFDLFFKDMDRSLREMGTGDMGIPKKIQKMGELFYGLLEQLNDALENKDQAAVKALLLRNFYGAKQNNEGAATDNASGDKVADVVSVDGAMADQAENLAQYAIKADAHLNQILPSEIAKANFEFGQ